MSAASYPSTQAAPSPHPSAGYPSAGTTTGPGGYSAPYTQSAYGAGSVYSSAAQVTQSASYTGQRLRDVSDKAFVNM